MSEGVIIAIITAISGTLIQIITHIRTVKEANLQKVKDDIEKIKSSIQDNNEGTKVLLADKLKFLCSKALNEGEIDYDSLRIIENLYKSYHQLGGNGFMTDIYEKVKELPITFKERQHEI